MGLGYGKREWDDYEWFPSGGGRRGPAVLAEPGDPDGASAALVERVLRDPIWEPDDAPRILLVDLDNLRAGPGPLAGPDGGRGRAGSPGRPRRAGGAGGCRSGGPGRTWRSSPSTAVAVAAGSDLADVALLAKVDELDLPDAQHLVVSNDGIFAELAQCGPLVVLSPGRDALSDSLAAASVRVIDLAALEHDLPAPARA